jgi:hypothetical protein
MTAEWLFRLHLTATLLMVGIIWFVQIVHYPLMTYVDQERFLEYSIVNQARTSRVVVVPMLVELASAIALTMSPFGGKSSPAFYLSLVGLTVVWLSTFCWQVPMHKTLLIAHDPMTIHRLVRSNWLRTFGWTARGVLLLTCL